jgi:hypothetical protein
MNMNMKKLLIIALALTSAAGAYAQGTIQFVNNGAGLKAPVYGINSGNPTEALQGNTSTGTPAGSTVYAGGGLVGTGFSAQLWGSAVGGSLQPLLDTAGNSLILTFRTTGGSAAGIMIANPTGLAAAVPGVAENGTASIQLRAWDNSTGSTWATATTRGQSAIFSSAPLGGTVTQPPLPTGLTSFNIATVPEPSTIALGVMGISALLIRRRK